MKHLVLSAVLMITVFAVTAQTRLALKAGYNHNTARIHIKDVKQPTGYQPGFNLGIQLKAAFEPPLHFTGLVSYNTRGFTLTPLEGDTDRVETTMHYLNIAPMLSYDIATGKSTHFTLTAGPMAGLGLSGTQKITAAGETNSSKMKFSTASDYGVFDLAIYNSLGYHFDKMFIEASYYLGFVSINNNEESDRANIKNRGFGLSLGYYIR
jgi:hypothetical protein